jgi:hypothetical protein
MSSIEIADDASMDQRASLISSLLDDDEGAAAAAETEAPETESATDEVAETAPAEAPASDDQPEGDEPSPDATEVEPAQPAIEPPATYPAELRDRFKQLPPDLQRDLAQLETERNRGVSQKLEEAARIRQAAETERQRYAQQLDHALTLATSFDPDIATAAKMTPAQWAQLAAENPGEHVRLQAKMQQVNALQAEREHIAQAQRAETVATETARLIEAMPELRDPAKARAFTKDVTDTLASYGFTERELHGLSDHRMLQVVRDAIAYRKGEAARKAAAAKVAKPVPKVQKPGTGERAQPARNEAILKRARSASSLHDKADALAALLD